MDWEEDLQPANRDRRQHAQQVMKNVLIPSSVRSSVGSSLSSVHDQSSECDTAATSVAVTPAESVAIGRELPRNHPSRDVLPPIWTTLKGKRKRAETDTTMGADILLAEALQEEEYEAPSGVKAKLKRAPRRPVADSDDSESQLSEISIEDFFGKDDFMTVDPPKPKRRKEIRRLPSREAPKSTTKPRSGDHIISRQIIDSEDSEVSELSDASVFTFNTAESDAPEDSEDFEDEDILANNDLNTGQAVSTLTRQTPAAITNRHRRRVALNPPGNSWRRMRPGGMDSRAARERLKLEKAHPEIKTMWHTLKETAIITPVEAKQPTTITRKLKSFQLEGLDWMKKQETSQWKGGLLGDEMGMGKTSESPYLEMLGKPILKMISPGRVPHHVGLSCTRSNIGCSAPSSTDAVAE